MPDRADHIARLRSVRVDTARLEDGTRWSSMVAEEVWSRLRAANQRETAAWREVSSRAEWEAFRDARLAALRGSLGAPASPGPLNVRVTGTVEGQGFRVENLVFESRPGLVVTANLYAPGARTENVPGILICHSHHNPKTQDELQDMGMNWARQGAVVLVMDQLGHGERRQQPFGGRQDYISRSVLGMQLHLVGESLMGWMVWDLMRGVDLLLLRPDVDPDRLILIGSVAGGGDPAAVAAAIDPRITCVVPFNFGGPQPETPYPLPDDAEDSFNYAGIPELESTRCLRLNGRDGFMPWLIVASVAPRYLIYGHEFSWDRDRDPVWQRLQRVFGFYGAETHLAFAHGWGVLSGRPPEASHCNNVGPPHRRMLYPALQRWFGLNSPEPEYQGRLPAEALACLPGDAVPRHKKVHEFAQEIAAQLASATRKELAVLAPAARRAALRRGWGRLLGDVDLDPGRRTGVLSSDLRSYGGLIGRRIVLETDPGIAVPMLLLHDADRPPGQSPVVIGIAQEGKAGFLAAREREIAELLANGISVCLPDLRGTGETQTGDSRGLRLTPSEATVISPAELMLGQTMVGRRLRDLRAVMAYVRRVAIRRPVRLALWGDSFAPPNPPGLVDPPAGSAEEPHRAEPLGAMLALLGALFEDDVVAVVARRGLIGLASVLASPFAYVPHDVIVPGALALGDLADVAAELAPRPLWLQGLVDGRNCAVPQSELESQLLSLRSAYGSHPDHLQIVAEAEGDVAPWLAARLQGEDSQAGALVAT